MIVYKVIELDGGSIEFGVPDSEEEKREMFKLRYQVYVKEKKYIPENIYDKEEDVDHYDRAFEPKYFIAKINGVIVGTTRVIQHDPLPTESEYFDFKRVPSVEAILPENRAEIGRIISRPHSVEGTTFSVPSRVVILGLFDVMTQIGLRDNIKGGYSAIKEKALEKMEKSNVPIHRIKKYKLKYSIGDSEDPLKNFFSEDDPVVPVYFLTREVSKYFSLLFGSELFKKIDEKTFRFTGRKLSIITKVRIKFLI